MVCVWKNVCSRRGYLTSQFIVQNLFAALRDSNLGMSRALVNGRSVPVIFNFFLELLKGRQNRFRIENFCLLLRLFVSFIIGLSLNRISGQRVCQIFLPICHNVNLTPSFCLTT